MEQDLDLVRAYLGRVLGRVDADAFLRALLAELALQDVRTPGDLYRLGSALCERSSDVAAAGHFLKTKALLRGAARAPVRP